MIATPTHRAAFLERLHAEPALRDDRLKLLDAEQTLAGLITDGMPHWQPFQETLGAMVAELCARHPAVRAYGEMVDLLAAEGNVEAALALERLWNDLAETVPFTLMCGYAAAHFAGTSAGHRHLRTVCELHSEVQRDKADLLANWLLSDAESTV